MKYLRKNIEAEETTSAPIQRLMKLPDSSLAFIEAAREIEKPAALVDLFQSLIQTFGFKHFAAGSPSAQDHRNKTKTSVVRWPEGWAQRYACQSYVTLDPVGKAALSRAMPFRWRDLAGQATELGQRLMNEAREFGMIDGFAIGLHGEDRTTMCIAVAGEHYDLSPTEEACLHMSSIYFSAKLKELERPKSAKQQVCLTSRERECLSWVAAGKTDKDISVILGITAETARWYVTQAARKLDACNRPHAVALGIGLNLINI
jgi:LuxR family transcriptional regulator, quorum-sensing system regulator BjaR1